MVSNDLLRKCTMFSDVLNLDLFKEKRNCILFALTHCLYIMFLTNLIYIYNLFLSSFMHTYIRL